jgi:hypothetical protein
MIILLRDELGDGPNADVEAQVLRVTQAEFFPDRINFVSAGEHDGVGIDDGGDFWYDGQRYGFCIIYEDEMYQTLMEEFNLI